jgi:pteridine reductase
MSRHPIYVPGQGRTGDADPRPGQGPGPSIRVNAVAPGAILWPENDDSPEAADAILERIPLGHQGRPEDIAGAVCFLALDAPYITGQILAVDGGRMLNM